MRIDRHALFQAGQLVSAAAPPHRASATGRTKAVLRDVSGVGQPRETDSSLSHCTVSFSLHDAFIMVRPGFVLC